MDPQEQQPTEHQEWSLISSLAPLTREILTLTLRVRVVASRTTAARTSVELLFQIAIAAANIQKKTSNYCILFVWRYLCGSVVVGLILWPVTARVDSYNLVCFVV